MRRPRGCWRQACGGWRVVEIWERLQEIKEKKVECEKLREMLDWMKAEVGR